MDELRVLSWNEAEDGPLSEDAMRRKLEAMGYRVRRYVYPPGTYFPPHTHEVDKMDGVLAGRFRMTMFGRTVVLKPGEMLFVPKGAVHEAEVVGDAPVVSLDAVRA